MAEGAILAAPAATAAAEGAGALADTAAVSGMRAESALQGSLLRQQLAAEEIAGARMPSQISGS